ncbi:uncharacterized protein [Rutidosis leptorrhynchoides]|uniref:uncharacterized protein n=1 Tax=Rutidosis leptorrhynchoides TaxID=125765 RepID=UPI003A998E83
MDLSLECPICGADMETMLHIFRECCWVKTVWNSLRFDSVANDPSSNLFDWLNSVFSSLVDESFALFVLAAYSIWSNRNSIVFEAVCTRPSIAAAGVNYWLANLRMLDQLCAVEAIAGRVHNDHWMAPEDEFIKINFDASFIFGSSTNRFGFVARDNQGRVLEAATGIISHVEDALHAEVCAALAAVDMANRLRG